MLQPTTKAGHFNKVLLTISSNHMPPPGSRLIGGTNNLRTHLSGCQVVPTQLNKRFWHANQHLVSTMTQTTSVAVPEANICYRHTTAVCQATFVLWSFGLFSVKDASTFKLVDARTKSSRESGRNKYLDSCHLLGNHSCWEPERRCQWWKRKCLHLREKQRKRGHGKDKKKNSIKSKGLPERQGRMRHEINMVNQRPKRTVQ